MSFTNKCFATISPVIVALDQWTKWLVQEHIPFGTGFSVIPGYFDLVHVTNPGAAFGMFAGANAAWRVPFFYAVSLIAFLSIVGLARSMPKHERLMPIVLSLIMGGLFGNLIDRIRFGEVTDFLAVHIRDVVWNIDLGFWSTALPLDWPAFNVADSAITVSMVLLGIQIVRGKAMT